MNFNNSARYLPIHRHVSCITTDIWSSIIEYLPFKSFLLLLETGDSRIELIRKAIRHLRLNRIQIRCRPFPTYFLNSFSNIVSLSISTTNTFYHESLQDLHSLCDSLSSLTILLTAQNAIGVFHVLSLLLRRTNDDSPPKLSELTITNEPDDSHILEMQQSHLLGSIIMDLQLTVLTCKTKLHPCVVSYLPKTLNHLRISLYATSNEIFFPAQVNLPNLLTMRIKARNPCYRVLTIPMVIPASVTHLDITTNDTNIWSRLPSGLLSLSITGVDLDNAESVSALPRMLEKLRITDSLNPEFIPYLPPNLQVLERESTTVDFYSVDPSVLPRSLNRLNMYSIIEGGGWKNLPRGLHSVDIAGNVIVSNPSHFPFIGDIPSLLGISFLIAPTVEVLRAISNRQSLKILSIYSNKNLDFMSVFSSYTFTSLERLNLSLPYVDCDILNAIQIPSLTNLAIQVIGGNLNFNNDLISFPRLNKLNYLLLSCTSDRHRNPSALPSFFQALPSTLTALGLVDYVVDLSQLSVKSFPSSLTKLTLSLSIHQQFSFTLLSKLPNSIQKLSLFLNAVECGHRSEEFILQSSLKDILSSLPRSIRSFSCFDHSLSYGGQKYINLKLEDCINEFVKLDIFLDYLPPFTSELISDLIDPKQSFRKARELLNTPRFVKEYNTQKAKILDLRIE